LIGTQRRVAPDTNVLISSILRPSSVPARALAYAIEHEILITSVSALAELAEVLKRPKFAGTVSLSEVEHQVSRFTSIFRIVEIVSNVPDCRDPKDDKFLDIALNGKADILLTGDEDLLCLHPWRGISILKCAEYLALNATNGLP
jgi:putative PIN family toxin of toxin-antitoxin system